MYGAEDRYNDLRYNDIPGLKVVLHDPTFRATFRATALR